MFIRKDKRDIKRILPYWLLLAFTAFFYGFFYWQPILDIYNYSGLGFRLERIYILRPILWFLLWSLCLAWLRRNYSAPKINIIILLLLSFQLVLNFYFYIWKAYIEKPTFREFMAAEQFEEIRKFLPETGNNFRVGCIGFYPSVANYNGFKTVDSFSAYYPLSYKQAFRKIIVEELDKNEELKDYFDNKGSALYLFDDEIGFAYRNQELLKQSVKEIHCDLNFLELKKFGVKYLFSTVKITNADEVYLKKIELKKNSKDYYDLYVYELL
jgi:hypothetical protein